MERRRPLVTLAPLAGYTNIAYRTFLKPFGADIVVSEMISDFALIYHNQETQRMAATAREEAPVALQLFGGSQDSLLGGIRELQSFAAYDYLDINLGCPVQKVVKNGAGSSWLRKQRQEELFEAMSAVVSASRVPVTCKIRLGWSETEITVVETCRLLERAGVAMITVHGRTRSQLYSGTSDYAWIKKAKDAVRIPIIANGDIDSPEKAAQVLSLTGCDGVAIGRGCLGNPMLLTQIRTYLDTGIRLPDPDIRQQTQFLKEHYERLAKLKGAYAAVHEFRGIASWYLKGFPHTKPYRIRLSRMQTEEEFRGILAELLSDSGVISADC